MNKPNQVIPSFVSVFRTSDQVLAVAGVILFDVIETDGTDANIYDRTTGTFTAPVSAWYDIDVQIQGPLTELYIIRNGDINFPVIGVDPTDDLVAHIRGRMKLALGETVQVFATGTVTALFTAASGAITRASNTIFTMVKRFDDTKTF